METKQIYTDHREIEIHCKGVDEGYYKAKKEELKFLKTLPTQSGKASQYQRSRLKEKIEKLTLLTGNLEEGK